MKMIKQTGLLATVAVIGITGWVVIESHIWPQTNYVTSGVCSAQDIDRTYAALMKTGRIQDAAINRMGNEYWSHTKKGYPVQVIPNRTLEVKIKRVAYKHFWKRQTAAFACTNGSTFFDTQSRVHTVPEIDVLLRPFISNPDERWEIAACAAVRETYAPKLLTDGTVSFLRDTCTIHPTRH